MIKCKHDKCTNGASSITGVCDSHRGYNYDREDLQKFAQPETAEQWLQRRARELYPNTYGGGGAGMQPQDILIAVAKEFASRLLRPPFDLAEKAREWRAMESARLEAAVGELLARGYHLADIECVVERDVVGMSCTARSYVRVREGAEPRSTAEERDHFRVAVYEAEQERDRLRAELTRSKEETGRLRAKVADTEQEREHFRAAATASEADRLAAVTAQGQRDRQHAQEQAVLRAAAANYEATAEVSERGRQELCRQLSEANDKLRTSESMRSTLLDKLDRIRGVLR